ncbi:unnamed protein product [Parascedosporium putredinis]|uniref:Cytochrome b561 domain-containing protein n=1 Tax=Parascedosporium putredinis TaxID=1442378 RepID=A0A9P1MD87_9PEZI|nr:unnamed protein product [Parascedosporium putredinis]CAI8003145.1 unnamed protein product [Parascedosporium putredinis]
MAPTPDDFSTPGMATYDSDTLKVGDGTWDFTKDTFLLPPLVGVNFDTMRLNGMGNRFASLTQYHTIIMAHAILAALVFLLVIPLSVMTVRFYDRRQGYARSHHARLNVFGGILLLVVFILGNFAVGRKRSLTNPHHGIGVAIFLLYILQMVGGRLGDCAARDRADPLGLTLYGSPLYLFILYAVWMALLVLIYFILEFRRQGRRDAHHGGGRSDAHSHAAGSEYPATNSGYTEKPEKRKWMAPLLAGAGLLAFIRSRVDHHNASSHPGTSYFSDEKSHYEEKKKGGGLFTKLAAAGAAFGAFKMISGMGKKGTRGHEDEYSAVSTDTPSRRFPPRRGGPAPSGTPTMAAHAMSAASGPPGPAGSARPYAPRPAHSRNYSRGSFDDDSYESPSRRPQDGKGGGAAKGILAGLGMGWLASRFGKKKKAPRDDESFYKDEEDRRSGLHGPRYTGDGFPSPTRNSHAGGSRRHSRQPSRLGSRPPPSHLLSDESSIAMARPSRPAPASGIWLCATPMPGHGGSHRDVTDPIRMPAMPPDPLDSRSSLDRAPGNKLQRRDSSRRRRAGAEAAAAAAASASVLAAEEEQRRHHERGAETRIPRRDSRGRRQLKREQRRRRGDSASKAPESGTGMTADADSALSPRTRLLRGYATAQRLGLLLGCCWTFGNYTAALRPAGLEHGERQSRYLSEAMSPSPGDRPGGSAAENRRRRRQQRQTSLSTRPVAGNDMFD